MNLRVFDTTDLEDSVMICDLIDSIAYELKRRDYHGKITITVDDKGGARVFLPKHGLAWERKSFGDSYKHEVIRDEDL